MNKRTEDLALQARERAQAEQRQGNPSRQGNSDAAESPRALKHEQDRKALERSQPQFPNENFRGLTADQEEALRRDAEERQRQAELNAANRTEGEPTPAVQGQGSDAQVLSRQGNSDAAESPRALKHEQDRKALERSQPQFPNENFRGLTADQEEALRRDAEERQRQAELNAANRTEGEPTPAVQGQGSDAQVLNEAGVQRAPEPLLHDARHSPDSLPTKSADEPAKAG